MANREQAGTAGAAAGTTSRRRAPRSPSKTKTTKPQAAARPEAAAPAPTLAPEADGPRWPHVPMRWPEQERFTAPWMVPWLEAAAASLSVREACRRAGIGLAQYLIGRQNDLAFDRAALIFDQIVDLMIQESVRSAALDGDPQATRIYFGKVRLPAFLPGFASWAAPARKPPELAEEPLPPHVAEAMIAAGMEAMKHPPPDPGPDAWL